MRSQPHRRRRQCLAAVGVAVAIALVLASSGRANGAGSVACWGENIHGECGAGFKGKPTPPVAVKGLQGVREVSAAFGANYALLPEARFDAWGGNLYSQLGLGYQGGQSLVPLLNPLVGVKQVCGAGAHAMALSTSGVVYTWGSFVFGETGDGRTTKGTEKPGQEQSQKTPKPVPGLPPARAIACGGPNDIAILQDGRVMGWGYNGSGQLGLGDTVERTRPALVPGLSNVTQVSIGGQSSFGSHMLALRENGTVMAAGRNDHGQLGDGTTIGKLRLVPVRGLTGVTAVSNDLSHSLALAGGSLYTWGQNAYGQLGTGGKADVHTPLKLALPAVTSISAAFRYSVVVSQGRVYAWGWNNQQQLGDGTKIKRAVPQLVPGVGTATQVSAGDYHALAVLTGEAPPPPITATPGPGSLSITWTAPEHRTPWTIAWRPVTRPTSKWGGFVTLPPPTRSYTISRLPPGHTVEVIVKNRAFGTRVVTGTPR
jgi:alpha-tubulin suppressor-like RCC1 family protein